MRTESPEQTVVLGMALGAVAQPGDIILLVGDLGAGKTQFVKGIAQGLGIMEPVTSPTFNIMLSYSVDSADTTLPTKTLNHFDLYRLDDVSQLEDIDYFGCLENDAVSVVEWGDKFPDALPLDYIEVALRIDEESSHVRAITTVAHGSRAVALLAAWIEAAGRSAPIETSA